MEDKILGNDAINENNQPTNDFGNTPETEIQPVGETVFYFDEEPASEETTEEILPTVEIDNNGAIVVEFGSDEDNVEEPMVESVVEPEIEPVVEPEVEPVVEPEIEPEIEPIAEPEAEPVEEKIPDISEPTPEIIEEEKPENNNTDFVPLPVTNNKKKEKAPKPKKEKPVKFNPEPVLGYESVDDYNQNNKKNKKLDKKQEKKEKDKKKNLISFILLLLLFAIPVGFLVYIIMAILSFFS